jgi:hypothetical protein
LMIRRQRRIGRDRQIGGCRWLGRCTHDYRNGGECRWRRRYREKESFHPSTLPDPKE